MLASFTADPSLGAQLFDLLDVVFPGIRDGAQTARDLGASWESVSTPFIHFEDGRPVSHVGVIELSLVLAGQPVTAGSIHAVATHPAHRRRGYFRRLMEETLAYCAPRYQTLVLSTEHPEYYTPFGFRAIQEHCFTVKCDTAGSGDGCRLLDLGDPGDVALLHRLLETREPVSHVAGVVGEKAVFIFNESRRPLRYAADLDALVCAEMEDRRLKLFDVAAPSNVPPLAALLDRMPGRIEEVTIFFSPDRLGLYTDQAQAVPYILDHDGPSYLMARGPFPAEGQPFTLPRSVRT